MNQLFNLDSSYNPQAIEHAMQEKWSRGESAISPAKPSQPKYYCLAMCPYPSGSLHMGHVRNYTLTDLDARFHRLLGKQVLHPISWDSFGLPAENAARAQKINPETWTAQNIETMTNQLKNLGISFNWEQSFASHDPNYFVWEQKLFLKLCEDKLAYRKEKLVYWCENDQTVLANEQVEEGRCWRCGGQVETRMLSQWFLKLTAFAKELDAELEHLTQWPQQVRQMQKNWIGKKSGLCFFAPIEEDKGLDPLEIFIDKPDVFMQATHIEIPMHHPIIFWCLNHALQEREALKNLFEKEGLAVGKMDDTTQNAKLRLPLTVLHPLCQRVLPCYACCNLPVGESLFALVSNQDPLTGSLPKSEIRTDEENLTCADLLNLLKAQGILARFETMYRLKDWSISRQRAWGAPIPALEDSHGVMKMETASNLPVTLPRFSSDSLTKNPLRDDAKWKKNHTHGPQYTRIPETFDTFLESSWYFLRHCSPAEQTQMFDRAQADFWMPIDHYVGGIEHATMHLIYFRFFQKLLHHYGLISTVEPCIRLTCQGMVLSDAFYKEGDNLSKIWISNSELSLQRNEKGEIISALDKHGAQLTYAGCCKMSKSKNNGVNPLSVIETYGADALRFFILFAAPVQQNLQWSLQGVAGATRFLKKVWRLGSQILNTPSQDQDSFSPDLRATEELIKRRDECIQNVTRAYGKNFTINVGIANMMKFFNYFSEKYAKDLIRWQDKIETFQIFLCLLYPVAPHLSEALWDQLQLQHPKIFAWPQPLTNAASRLSEYHLVIQCNGKKIGLLPLSTLNVSQEEIWKKIKKIDQIQKRLVNQKECKVIYVPGKVFNIVS